MEKDKPALPGAYVDYMNEMLAAEALPFLESYGLERTQGLRLNARRLEGESGRKAADSAKGLFELQPVPWCPTGYYYEEPYRPGKHPYHEAGLYYIQEPSAMSAAELLAPLPGEAVLDLAAAPGGKTTHLASLMQGKGLLVSNEIHPERAKILAENVERLGLDHVLVTSAAPGELSSRFPEKFDRIMLDAPCSGEGMFRKDPGAVAEWSPEHVAMCAARQWDIVQDAVAMLKPGGRLAYSTCTFNREENEKLAERITAHFPDMELLSVHRLWPHRDKGEGHFVAVLGKSGLKPDDRAGVLAKSVAEGDGIGRAGKKRRGGRDSRSGGNAEAHAAWSAFADWAAAEVPGLRPAGEPLLFGDALYALPEGWAALGFHSAMLQGLRVPRAGLHVAQLKKNRLEPAHALAMSLQPAQAARVLDLSPDSTETAAYLRGEALPVPADLHGWTLVTVDGLPLGWGKASTGQLKNHRPKGLRRP